MSATPETTESGDTTRPTIPPTASSTPTAAPPATREHRKGALILQRYSREQLPIVRSAAMAWRNGLAGLLTALLGFGLIRGRSDIGQLASPWHMVVGLLLLAALLVGVTGALRILRAAHGWPAMRPVTPSTPSVDLDPVVLDDREARDSWRALVWGRRLSLCCVGLLVLAVGVTWYGPAIAKPKLRVVVAPETVCGSAVRIDRGVLTLRTSNGDRFINLVKITAIQAVESC